jgi:hypothetical protein
MLNRAKLFKLVEIINHVEVVTEGSPITGCDCGAVENYSNEHTHGCYYTIHEVLSLALEASGSTKRSRLTWLAKARELVSHSFDELRAEEARQAAAPRSAPCPTCVLTGYSNPAYRPGSECKHGPLEDL